MIIAVPAIAASCLAVYMIYSAGRRLHHSRDHMSRRVLAITMLFGMVMLAVQCLTLLPLDIQDEQLLLATEGVLDFLSVIIIIRLIGIGKWP